MKFIFNDGSTSEKLPPTCVSCTAKGRNPKFCEMEKLPSGTEFQCKLCKKVRTLTEVQSEK